MLRAANYSKSLAIVRPLGHHRLDISVNEKFNPFKRIMYLAGNLDPEEWGWLNLRRIELINLRMKPVFLFDPLRIKRGIYGSTSWAYLEGLEKWLESADFIDTSEVYPFFSRQCANIAKKLKKPLICSVIETIPKHISSRIPPYSWNTKFVIKRTSLFVVPTKRSKEYLLSLNAGEDKIKVIPFGVDTDIFAPASGRGSDYNVRILYVRNLDAMRGILDLLEAFVILYKEHRNVELWLCGTGPLENVITEYSKKYPVNYLGAVSWRDLPEIYRKCDVFVCPGKDVYRFGVKVFEDGQYTVAVLEAMASGLPVIVSDSSAYPEMVGPDNFVVNQGSVDQIANALKILITDAEKRKIIGRRNRERVEEMFSGRKQCRAYAEALMQLA